VFLMDLPAIFTECMIFGFFYITFVITNHVIKLGAYVSRIHHLSASASTIYWYVWSEVSLCSFCCNLALIDNAWLHGTATGFPVLLLYTLLLVTSCVVSLFILSTSKTKSAKHLLFAAPKLILLLPLLILPILNSIHVVATTAGYDDPPRFKRLQQFVGGNS
jgi:hypothetical protein